VVNRIVILIIVMILCLVSEGYAQNTVFFDMDKRLSDQPPSFLDQLPPTTPKKPSSISGMANIPIRKFRIQGNALFSGYDDDMRAILAMYLISESTLDRLNKQGIPSTVTLALEKLLNHPFTGFDQFFHAVKPLLSDNDRHVYQDVIFSYASVYPEHLISPETLHDIKRRLTRYYHQRGYINSIAIIPDQKVVDGVITIQIIEGRLTEISIFGNKHITSTYIFDRIQPVLDLKGRILNIHTLEKGLQDCIPVLKRNPRVKNINARLMPGISIGEATLEIHVEEAPMIQIKVNANNHHSPVIGAYCGEIGFRHLNLLSLGDTILLQYGMTEGLDDIAFNYQFPVNTHGAHITLAADQSESVVVADDYEKYDLTNSVTRFSLGVTWPFFQNIFHEFSMTARMERLHAETTFMGMPFKLDGADENGEADLTIAHCIHEWVHRSNQQVFGIRSTASFGLDAFNATINENEPDGRFATWLIQTQWFRQLDFKQSEIIARLDVRYSNQRLMPSQKFALGGAQSVRGYRENRITSDDGQLFSLQWQLPVMRLPWAGISQTAEDGYIIASCFFDYGNAHNFDTEDPSPTTISSIGTGLRWNINAKIFAQLYWAYALRDIEDPEQYDIQDDGVHFQVQMIVYE